MRGAPDRDLSLDWPCAILGAHVRTRCLLLLGFAFRATLSSAETPPPVVVALVFDTSGSLRPADIEAARDLCTGLLEALPKGSQAAVFAFADQSQLLLPRSADIVAIEAAVSSLRPTGHTTALYDALYDASRYLHDAPATRRALVLLTDGRDEGSALSVEDGLKVAQETRIPVFCVGVGKIQERVLRRVAKLTSGEYVPIAETTGGSLAARILAVTQAEAATAPTSPAAPTAAPAASPAPRAASVGTPGRTAFSLTLLVGLLLALVALLAAAVSFVRSGRTAAPVGPARKPSSPAHTAPRPDEAVATEAPATVFARISLGEEAVASTRTSSTSPCSRSRRAPARDASSRSRPKALPRWAAPAPTTSPWRTRRFRASTSASVPRKGASWCTTSAARTAPR